MSDDSNMRRWCYAVANDRARSQPNLIDDAAQEGMIGFWTAWQHRPGNLSYAKAAAYNRIVGLLTGHASPTGAPSRQGRRQADEQVLSGDDRIEDFESRYEEVEAEMAYHRREIAEAITGLTERQRKVVADIAFGVPLSSTGRGEWSGRLRPRLAEKLSHLREH